MSMPTFMAPGRAALAAAILLASAPLVHAQQKITAFIQPIAHYDAVWMAEANGFLADEGLDVTFRLFPSGTTALQSFKAGEGDILFGGDFPGVQYWLENNQDYRLIAAIERDPTSYLVTADETIKSPQDLKGKTIATRVGSTVDWFMSAYLEKNGIDKSDVTIKNLDGQVMPAALCQGDINAFFFWQPYNDTAVEICPDKAHNLSNAEGYIPGYVIMAARPEWLSVPANAEAAKGFLRAILKGKEVAENDLDAVAKYAQEKLSMPREAVEAKWKTNNRVVALNQQVFDDYCSLASWMRAEGKLADQFDLSKFVWMEGLEAVDPSRVSAVPAPC